jgi:hypothetical protein
MGRAFRTCRAAVQPTHIKSVQQHRGANIIADQRPQLRLATWLPINPCMASTPSHHNHHYHHHFLYNPDPLQPPHPSYTPTRPFLGSFPQPPSPPFGTHVMTASWTQTPQPPHGYGYWAGSAAPLTSAAPAGPRCRQGRRTHRPPEARGPLARRSRERSLVLPHPCCPHPPHPHHCCHWLCNCLSQRRGLPCWCCAGPGRPCLTGQGWAHKTCDGRSCRSCCWRCPRY